MRKLVSVGVVLALMSAQLMADPATDARHAQKIRIKADQALEHHRVVTVETADHRRLQGLVSETQPDHFVLIFEGRTTTLTYAEVERITWPQHMPRPVVAALTGLAVAGVLYGVVHLLLARNG